MLADASPNVSQEHAKPSALSAKMARQRLPCRDLQGVSPDPDLTRIRSSGSWRKPKHKKEE